MTSQFTYELLVVPALLALLLGRLRLRVRRRASSTRTERAQHGQLKASAYLRVRFEPRADDPA